MCGRKTTVAEYSVVKEPASTAYVPRWRGRPATIAAVTCRFLIRRPLEARRQREPSCVRPWFGGLALPSARFCEPLGRQSLGGEYRARTGDLLVANQALSQLS